MPLVRSFFAALRLFFALPIQAQSPAPEYRVREDTRHGKAHQTRSRDWLAPPYQQALQ